MNERLCIKEVGVDLELCVHAHGHDVDIIIEASLCRGKTDPRTPMGPADRAPFGWAGGGVRTKRSEEHTSELQSRE